MSVGLGIFFTAALTLLVVAIQFIYSPMSSQKDYQKYRENCIPTSTQKDYQNYRENCIPNIKHPILERYRYLTYAEEEDSSVDYTNR